LIVVLGLGCLGGVTPGVATAAELQASTTKAYDAYLEEARGAFLARVRARLSVPPQQQEGVRSVGPAREDGIINVPDGLVHNWKGTAFVRGVTLQEVLDVSHAYSTYNSIYKSIIVSRLLEQKDDTYHAFMRLKDGAGGVSAVLDIRTTIQYFSLDQGRAYSLSGSDEIREVKNAGTRTERALPPGHDSGYLWRANTFTLFVEQNGGVYIELETLGLSRRFPLMTGWIIEPIARRLGRKSVENSLQEFLAAVRIAHP
jgi:hypothetical protein